MRDITRCLLGPLAGVLTPLLYAKCRKSQSFELCVCGLIWDVIKKKTTYSFAQLVARIIYFVIDILFACDIMQLQIS